MGGAETARRFLVQRRVRSLVIVLFAPFFQLLERLTHALKVDSTQYLVEAFYLTVLRRLPRTRELERYSPLFAPLLHIPTPKFRSVVALYRLRSAVQTYQPVQRLRFFEYLRDLLFRVFFASVAHLICLPILQINLLIASLSYFSGTQQTEFPLRGALCPLRHFAFAKYAYPRFCVVILTVKAGDIFR